MTTRSTPSELMPPFGFRRLRAALALCFMLVIVTAGALTVRLIEARRALEGQALQLAQTQAAQAGQEIDQVFTGIVAIAQYIADDLSSGRLSYADIDARMVQELEARPDIDGLAVTFQPYAYDTELELYQSYNYRDAQGDLQVMSGATYDYSQPPTDAPDSPQTGWYHGPLENGAMWNEPFFATGAQKVLIEYGVPFTLAGDSSQVAGVVTIDYSLAGMRNLMSRMTLGETGYGFVISADGLFLSHPITLLVARAHIADFAAENGYPELADAAARALAGETVSININDPVAGPSWLFFEPIPATGWALGIILPQAEFTRSPQVELQDVSGIIIAVLIAVVLGIALMVHVERGASRSLWIVSLSYSIASLIAIIVIVALALNARYFDGVSIITPSAASRFAESYQASLPPGEPLVTLPTGILVKSVTLPSPTSAMVNGIVWQRIPEDAPPELTPGIRFSETTGNQVILNEVSRAEDRDSMLITWEFGVELKQTFDPGAFPFDQHSLHMQIEPLDLRVPILLTPSLQDYALLSPALLPGLDGNLALSSWRIESSLFNYQLSDGDQNVAIGALPGLSASSDFTFSINLERIFIGPVIAFVLPALVAAGMMFAFIMGDPKVGDQEEIISTLSFTAALFFVITVVQTALRESVAAVGITYLENLYLTLYVIIILATVNSFLVVRTNSGLLRFRNNLFTKLLFWPLFASVMLLATLGTFVSG